MYGILALNSVAADEELTTAMRDTMPHRGMRGDKDDDRELGRSREPYLDHALVEFAFALPPEMKVRALVGEYVLKESVADLLPPDITYRPKQGFGAPTSEWVRFELGKRAQREIRESSLAERGLIDYDSVEWLWQEHLAGRGDWSFQLRNLYNVSAWHDYWVAGRTFV